MCFLGLGAVSCDFLGGVHWAWFLFIVVSSVILRTGLAFVRQARTQRTGCSPKPVLPVIACTGIPSPEPVPSSAAAEARNGILASSFSVP